MAHALRSINRIIREALAAINVEEVEQQLTLECYDIIIDGVNARHVANFLRQHPHAIDTLVFAFSGFTLDAVEIFCVFLAETTICSLRMDGFLINENGGRLLSSLHGNESIKELDLLYFGMEDQIGGRHLSDLLQNNSTLTTLRCRFNHVGLEGARALQPGIRANETVETLVLSHCWLGDEGFSLLVDSFEGNSSITYLGLDRNRITASGLPHLTRLLQQRDSCLEVIDLDNNPGLLDNQENTLLFSTALSQCTTISVLRMSFCQSPASSVIALFQAAVINKEIQVLCINDHVQLEQGQDLQSLLDIIPKVNLLTLYINLDFTAEDVISSFHRNMTIQHLHSGEIGEEITAGPVFGSLERSRLLHYSVRMAVEAIDVDEEEQELTIIDDDLVIDEINAGHITDSLRLHPRAVKSLVLGYDQLTTEAVEIFRAFLAESTLRDIVLEGNLGNDKGARLLSGVHGNTSITKLELTMIGLDGTGGGAIISELLRQVPNLKTLICRGISLGVEGARALQSGIRANLTVEMLGLDRCNLGIEGLSVIVDALLEGNTTITNLCLARNSITARGLPHLTRLLQNPSLAIIDFVNNPGLFDDEETTRLFSTALRNAKVGFLRLSFCQLPDHAVITLFQAITNNETLTTLDVYDRVQLQEPHLDRLLEIIPQMRNLQSLHVNLDFTNESVLSSLHRNSSIVYLQSGEDREQSGEDRDMITTGTAAAILERNGRLLLADELLDREFQRTIPLGGVWAKTIERLTIDSTGATAAYKILREKLVMWWAPPGGHAAAAPAPLSVPSSATPSQDACGTSAAASPSASRSNNIVLGTQDAATKGDKVEVSFSPTTATITKTAEDKRSYTLQASIVDGDNVEKSATTDSDEPLKKRARHSCDNSTSKQSK